MREARDRTSFVCRASPSLALLKYWGKLPLGHNLPATPSLALSLGSLVTSTRVEASFEGEDEVRVGGALQGGARYAAFFAALRRGLSGRRTGELRSLAGALRFRAWSRNDFPTASGLASSSSGFAALALAGVRAAESLLEARPLSTTEISRIARIGSVSAARAVFGGFCLLPAGAREARPLFDEAHWPELRILVALVSREEKPLTSREAMERCRRTSVFHRAWLGSARRELEGSLAALGRRDLEALGNAMRRSYLRMFGAMLGCEPPLVYWLPGSLAIIHECESLRGEGIGVWETMDAGPQVKMLCLASDLPRIKERIASTRAASSLVVSCVGAPPIVGASLPGDPDFDPGTDS